ncbi:kinase-like domain-containing protein [Aspergillus carlsbadensis]|nr:kinase-like domain-containing protein [Aspergillus carlsbadensis]
MLFSRSPFRLSSKASLRTARLISTTRSETPSTRQATAYNNESLFGFTRGRFLTNERQELAQRHAPFNVDELAKLAAEATTGNGRRTCVGIEKLADGMHNKAIRFTMDDGFQVIGKVPNPNAGLPHYTTASEVATMDFMRSVFDTPVPKVFSWSSSADNPVAAEYILMENARGVSLSKIWDTLDVDVQFKVLKRIAMYQRAWSDVSFAKYGSLYYSKDVPQPDSGLRYTNQDGKEITDERFTVGPSAGRKNVDCGRAALDFDRGPWRTVEDYERATGLRESFCVQNMSQLPRSPIAIHYSGSYQPSREKKLFAIQSYLKLVEHLTPKDETITTSHLWHDDLHVENVFVNPDDPSDIHAFIDWQSTELAPLYDHIIEPYILAYNGPPMDDLLERPKLADIQALFQDEPVAVANRKADSLFTKMSLVALYRFLLYKRMPRLFRALEFRQTDSFQLLLLARNLLIDGEATYLGLLAEQQENKWSGVPRISQRTQAPPLSFSQEDIQRIKEDAEAAARSMELMGDLRRMVGSQYFQAQGLVSHEQFRELEQILPTVKEEFLRMHARSEDEVVELDHAWPFDVPDQGISMDGNPGEGGVQVEEK